MKNYIWSTMPMVTCPHCEKEFQVDDYCFKQSGDTLYCQHCKKTIHILEMETVMSVRLGTDAE